MSCANIAADDTAVDALSDLIPESTNTFIRSSAEGAAEDDSDAMITATLTGIITGVLTGMLKAQAHSSNRCSFLSLQLDNSVQLLALDLFNTTGQQAILSSQACCACGGGTTAAQPADQQTYQGLVEFYHSTNGAYWTQNSGWLDEAVHFCMWETIRCDGRGSLFSIVQLAGTNDLFLFLFLPP